MKNRTLIYSFIIFLIAGIFVQFIRYDFLINLLKGSFSSDGMIEKSTYLYYQHKFQFIKILAICFPLFSLIFLVCFKKIEYSLTGIIQFIKKKCLYCYSKINIPVLFWFSLVFIIVLAIFAAINFDVGQDESFYLNDIQNIKNYGTVFRAIGERSYSYDIPNLPLNMIVNITVPLFGFSVLHIRIIILIFSLLLIPALIMLFGKETGLILTPLIFLFPGIFYLTSIIYLETTALLFIVYGLIFLKRYEDIGSYKHLILSVTFVALAMATKFQFIFWVGLILLMLMIVDYNRSALFIFKYFLAIYSIFCFLLLFNLLHYGIINGILFFKAYFLGGDTGGAVSFNLSKVINKSLFLNELIFIPLLVFIWIKSWKIIKNKYDYLYMKFIYVGAIAIVLHWLLFYSAMTWRNVFIGLVFNAVLFAIFLKENYRHAKLILIPYIVFGIIANYGFIKNGVLDEVQYYRVHVLDNMLSTRTKNDQKDFFREVSKIIQPEDIVYAPMQLFIPRLYLNNREIKYFKDYVKSEKRAYLVVFAGAVKEKYIEKRGLRKYLENSDVILQRGNYTLYNLH